MSGAECLQTLRRPHHERREGRREVVRGLVGQRVDDRLEDQRQALLVATGDSLAHDIVLARRRGLVIGPVGQEQLAGGGAERARECRREARQERRHAPGRDVLVALRLERHDDPARPGRAERDRGSTELDIDQEARRVRRERANDRRP